MIYLDNSTSSQPSEKAVAKMLPYLSEQWGNPSAPHHHGQKLISSMEHALKSLYGLLGAKEDDTIIVTSSGTEAVNHVFHSAYMDVALKTGKNHFVIGQTDEAAALMCFHRLESLGCIGKMAQPNHEGQITAQSIAESISPRTAMVSLSWANGLTGVINPVEEIAALCKDRKILFHLDATHVLGKLFFDLDQVGADFITFNGEQIHAPSAIGGLWIRSGVASSPFIVGGLDQGRHRAGNPNVPGFVALGEAAQEAIESRDYLCTEVARLRDKLETGIQTYFPQVKCCFKNQLRLPHISTILFPGIHHEAFLYALNRKNLFASIGGGNFQQISLIMQACGFSNIESQTAISFSLSRYNNEEEIDSAVEIIAETAKRLSKASMHIDRELCSH